jgi:hypothetical protein
MVEIRMTRDSHLVRRALVAAVVLSSLASPASAQTYHEFFGPPTPLVFDAQGARHWCLYLYSGPFTPPLVPNDSNIVSCRGNAFIQPATPLNKKPR